MVVLNDVFLFWPPNFSFSDDFFNKNGVYQLCFRQSKLNDCTIWYHSNGAVVWCSRLKNQNGAVVDGTIVVFYGTSDRLGENRFFVLLCKFHKYFYFPKPSPNQHNT